MKRTVKYAAVAAAVAGASVAVWASASSPASGPPLRDDQGRPITPGYEVAQLARGADGACHSAPGQELGLSGKGQPGEAGSVSLAVDPATCKLVVARVNEATPEDAPTHRESGGGQR